MISAVHGGTVSEQTVLVDAAKRAKVKRFIPADFGPACVPGVREMFDQVDVPVLCKFFLLLKAVDVEVENPTLCPGQWTALHVHRCRVLDADYFPIQELYTRRASCPPSRIPWKWRSEDSGDQQRSYRELCCSHCSRPSYSEPIRLCLRGRSDAPRIV